MSDISAEVEQLRNAVYGEEVRGAFISCMEKINDDNESYAVIKEEVKTAARTVEQQVGNIDIKASEVARSIESLQTEIRNAGTAKTALDESKKAADTSKTNLDASKKAADTSKTNLDASKKNADETKTSLQAVVDSAKQVQSNIGTAVTAANQAAVNANAAASEATTSAGKAERAASSATNAANAATISAQTADESAEDAKASASSANQAAQRADKATSDANQATGNANTAAAEALKQANSAKEAAASVRDDCYPMMFREYDGRVYSTFFYDSADTMVSTGIKMDDNADIATPIPSTDVVRNVNPYDDIPLFKPIECNGYVDTEGEAHITAVKGEPGFKTDGSNGDVCIALKTGYIRTLIGPYGPSGENGRKVSVTDSWQRGFLPYTAAIRPDGTVRPYILIPKYQGVSMTLNGIASYYSVPGYSPAYNVSHNNQITTFRKRGNQYCGETTADAEIWETLFEIAFATLNSQSIMAGCTNYSFQYAPAVTEENVERYVLTNAQAANVIVGSCVSIGDMQGNTSADRYYAYMHNMADRKIVTRKEALEDGVNTAIYVDNGGQTFSTTATCRLSSMPWYTGTTDAVKGTCGSPVHNTNGKYPFKFLGIEFALGQYIVRSDVILNGLYDSSADEYHQEIYTCTDCTKYATSITANYKKVGYNIPDTNNAWQYIKDLGYDLNFPNVRMPSATGADSSKRFADGLHTGGRANGTRGFRSLGGLGVGSLAGLRVASLDSSLGYAYWYFAARPSYTGRRGSVVDWATAQGVNLVA